MSVLAAPDSHMLHNQKNMHLRHHSVWGLQLHLLKGGCCLDCGAAVTPVLTYFCWSIASSSRLQPPCCSIPWCTVCARHYGQLLLWCFQHLQERWILGLLAAHVLVFLSVVLFRRNTTFLGIMFCVLGGCKWRLQKQQEHTILQLQPWCSICMSGRPSVTQAQHAAAQCLHTNTPVRR